MLTFVCATCGTSYPPAESAPERCAICDDERQWVPATGQAWTNPAQLERRHVNAWRLHEPDLFSIHTTPVFAIGQRAFLVRTPAGNILWDCIALID
ncbi:MAG: MBL fold metallo-hydrolase, partial [Microvirga sp.]